MLIIYVQTTDVHQYIPFTLKMPYIPAWSRRRAFPLYCILSASGLFLISHLQLLTVQHFDNDRILQEYTDFSTFGQISKFTNKHEEDGGVPFELDAHETELRIRDQNVSYVHLLSYQRSGSSFTGGLFANNPEAFFIYEPMDMLYSAMYGIPSGWSNPADIFYDKNGTLRQLPREEIDMMSWTMEKIFTCNMSSFPTSMLIHNFWGYFSHTAPDTKDFARCMQPLLEQHFKRRRGERSCQQKIRRFCPKRFDGKSGKMTLCQHLLWNSGQWYSNRSRLVEKLGPVSSIFIDYFKCVSELEDAAKQCAEEHLDKKCMSRSVRAVKTVRTPMQVAAKLLKKYPNLKVFHLLRDPRGATRSRVKAKWSWGLGEGKTVKEHAKRYCPNAVSDYKLMKSLEQIYPGRTMHVVYDGFVEDPVNTTKAMYKVVNKPVHDKVKTWLKNQTSERSTTVTHTIRGKRIQQVKTIPKSSTFATSWKTFYSYEEMQEIRLMCREFYRVINFPWA